MYKVNLLNTKTWDWEQLRFNGIPMTFSNKTTLLKALKDNLGTSQQILYEDWFLVTLDGSAYQLNWFIDNHDRLVAVNKRNRDSQKKYDNRFNEEPKQKVKRRK